MTPHGCVDMASHMKTTVHIPDGLLAEIQKIARKKKTTLRALVQEGLQHVVSVEHKKRPFKLRDASFGGSEVNPELRSLNWADIVDRVYEGRGG